MELEEADSLPVHLERVCEGESDSCVMLMPEQGSEDVELIGMKARAKQRGEDNDADDEEAKRSFKRQRVSGTFCSDKQFVPRDVAAEFSEALHESINADEDVNADDTVPCCVIYDSDKV